MGSDRNKIFLSIEGKPLLVTTIERLARAERFEEFILVVRSGEEDDVRSIVSSVRVPYRVVLGGTTRRDSSLEGVRAARGRVVLIHDAARPFPPRTLVEQVLAGAIEHGACVPALPIPDTLRYAADGVLCTDALDRRSLYAMQTPQGFNRQLIEVCLLAHPEDLPDDAAAVLAEGHVVHTVAGDPFNLKVTSADDLAVAERIAQLRSD